MKKFILMLAAVVATAFSSKADIVEIGGLKYDVDTESGTAKVTHGGNVTRDNVDDTQFSGKSYTLDNVVIPSSVEYKDLQYPVTAVGNGAFFNSNLLNSIVLPNTIEEIGNCAFQGCTALTSINLSLNDPLNRIGYAAFRDCSILQHIIIPDKVSEIGAYSFYGCTKLEDIIIPNNILLIGEYTFYNCTALKDVTMPQTVETIGDYAFYSCTNLNLVNGIPSGLKSLGSTAFYRCENTFDKLILPEGLTYIGGSAFGYCTSLNGIIVIPSTVKTVDSGAFQHTAIEGITFPEDLTLGVSSTFNNCQNLKKVRLPKKLKDSFHSAFINCTSLESIEFHPETEFNQPDKVEWRAAFNNCEKLKELIIPKGLKSIRVPGRMFEGCSALEYISGEGITDIDVNGYNLGTYPAFDNLPSLKELYLPSFKASPIYNGITWASNLTGLSTLFLGENVSSDLFKQNPLLSSPVRKLIVLAPTPPAITNGVISDRSNCVLYVPKESVETYKNTNYWLGFPDIRPYVFMANLELTAKTVKVQEGGALKITPVYDNDATYPRFDWSTSDYQVATVDREGVVTGLQAGSKATITARALDLSGEKKGITIKVVDYCPTDPNGDNSTTVSDATAVAKKILAIFLGAPYDERYDVNGDGNIDILDILAVIETILDDYVPGRANMRGASDVTANDELVAEDFMMEANGHAVVPVRLEGLSQYSALQADVTVKGGISIDDITIGSRIAATHAIAKKMISENTMRVIVYTAGDDMFADNDEPLFNIAISGSDASNASVSIRNILATEDGSRDEVLGFRGGMHSVVTGIDGVDNGVSVYAKDGAIVVANALGSSVAVYGVGGEMIESVVATSNPAVFNVGAGVYVVTVDGVSTKVIVK